MKSSPDIGLVLVTGHLGPENPAYTAVQNFIDIYEETSGEITIIGPASTTIKRKDVDFQPVQRRKPNTTRLQMIEHIYYQLRLAKAVYARRSQFDVVFFHLGGRILLFPLFTCKATRIPSVVFVPGSIKQSYAANQDENSDSRIMPYLIDLVEYVTNKLADRFVLLSENMRYTDRSVPWKKKVTANLNYIDCGKFVRKKTFSERSYDIVFVGRLERVKGVENLVRALPELVQKHPDISVNLIGEGSLREDLQLFVDEEGLSDHVDFCGWVGHDQIPDNLNEGRLLVLPSQSEGVPKALLEAMACGTIPVATPVGGIPDIIERGDTGFLLKDNEPSQITACVSEILAKDNPDRISKNARRHVYENHSFDAIREKYVGLLEELVIE